MWLITIDLVLVKRKLIDSQKKSDVNYTDYNRFLSIFIVIGQDGIKKLIFLNVLIFY